MLNYVFLVTGFALLIKGAEFFVDGSAGVARRLRILREDAEKGGEDWDRKASEHERAAEQKSLRRIFCIFSKVISAFSFRRPRFLCSSSKLIFYAPLSIF